jgi:hypothetical protein
MRHPRLERSVVLAAVVLAGTSPAAADPYVIRLPKKGTLYAIDGQVRLVPDGGKGRDKPGKGRDKPGKGKVYRFKHSSDLWEISRIHSGRALIQTRMRGPHNGWYLTCDHRGKEKGLFLSEKPVPGSYWWVGGGESEINSTISAKAVGPVYEWDLAVGGGPEHFAGKDGQAFPAYRVKLSRRGPKFRLTLTAP